MCYNNAEKLGLKGEKMKKLLVYLNGYKKECVFAPLFKMLEACFELFVPLDRKSVV